MRRVFAFSIENMNDASGHNFERTVMRRLAGLGRRLRLYVLLDGLAALSVAIVLCLVVTLAIDYTTRLDWDMRLAQLVSLGTALAVLGWWLLRPLGRTILPEQLAVLVERKFPRLSSTLISAVEFSRAGTGTRPAGGETSAAMRQAVVRRAADEVADLRFEAVLAHDRARRRAVVTLGCLLMVTTLMLAAPETMHLWARRNVLLENVAWPQRNRLTIEHLVDGQFIVPRNEDLTISAVVDDGYEAPRQAFVEFENDAGVFGREQMPAISHQQVRFTHTFERLGQSLRCRVVGGDAETEWFDVEVVDRPRIRNVVIEVVPPSYTNMDGYELRQGQTVAEVLAGSEVRFRVEVNKPLARAALMREEGNSGIEIGEARTNDGVRYESAVRPEATSTYRFELVDELGLSNRGERVVPVRFSIRLLSDKPPTVKMRIRDVGDMITKEAILPVEASFEDQYGLATAGVVFEIQREDLEPQPVFEPIEAFEPPARVFAHTSEWLAVPHGLQQGDRLTLFAQAEDLDDVGGPNVGKSTPIYLRVVTSEELLADLSRREQEHRRDFERLLRQQEELYAEMLKTDRPASSDDPGDFFPRLARRQRDHAGRLNLLRLQFEQVLAKLRMNQLSTPAAEARLGQGVIEPMDALYRTGMPQAAAALEKLPADARGADLADARAAQERVLAEMNRILGSLLKWEGYQEAVTLLREVLEMQKELGEETEAKVEEHIFGPLNEQ